ncbi:MAG: hypothetical protein MI923_15915 [Phycisphaerales bacterium]|nr:hypothetical protein [Phycisphaerales bacterium]
MRMDIRRFITLQIITSLVFGATVYADPRKEKRSTLPPDVAAQTQKAIDRGLAFLKSKQNRDGEWTAMYGPAVTAMVARAFSQDKRHGPKHPIVQRAVTNILRYEQPDGGIYERRQNLANYQTSIVLMLLGSLDDPAHKAHIAKAQAFLTNLQYDGAESIDDDHAWFGGAGYSKTKRPDLSNTQMMVEALHNSGLSKDDPVYQRALTFISRCQLNDATNDLPFAKGRTEGGFIYSPNAGGESKASEKLEEGFAPLRCYGSMTYAGFKSMLYANVARDDERIKACLGWIRRHYTLEVNPNMPGRQSKEGLYYYYHVFAKALQAWGKPVINDDKGKPHHWRLELCRKLISLQQEDGSWVNDQPRWLEGDANYVTGLTILTLQTALTD